MAVLISGQRKLKKDFNNGIIEIKAGQIVDIKRTAISPAPVGIAPAFGSFKILDKSKINDKCNDKYLDSITLDYLTDQISQDDLKAAEDNTLLYAGIGIAAALGIYLIMK